MLLLPLLLRELTTAGEDGDDGDDDEVTREDDNVDDVTD